MANDRGGFRRATRETRHALRSVRGLENTGLYGVDRRTRQNSPGYGDVNRYTLETRTAQ
jgi:hypothetical protein